MCSVWQSVTVATCFAKKSALYPFQNYAVKAAVLFRSETAIYREDGEEIALTKNKI